MIIPFDTADIHIFENPRFSHLAWCVCGSQWVLWFWIAAHLAVLPVLRVVNKWGDHPKGHAMNE